MLVKFVLAPPRSHAFAQLDLLAVATVVLSLGCGNQPASGPHILTITGRIECDETPIASKTPGRVLSIEAREGDRVAEGDLLVRLSADQATARSEQARAQLAAAGQELLTTRLRLPVIEERLRQIDLRVKQAQQQARGAASGAEGVLAAARADLKRAESESRQAQTEADRFVKLAAQDAVPKQAAEQASTKARSTLAVAEAARRHVAAAEGGLEAAKASSANAGILAAEKLALQRQADEARGVIAVAQAGVEAAQALVDQADADVAEFEILSPIDGFVVTRSAEPGQVIPPGRTLLTLADPKGIYFRGFVAESEIDRVSIGASAQIKLDALDRSVAAEVSRIDPEATFTPESVYFADERARQAVGVKLRVVEADPRLKLGMTGEATIDPR